MFGAVDTNSPTELSISFSSSSVSSLRGIAAIKTDRSAFMVRYGSSVVRSADNYPQELPHVLKTVTGLGN